MKQYSHRRTSYLAVIFATTLISALLNLASPAVFAQTSLSQCNGTDNVGGQAVECHYAVTNNLNGSETSSTTTVSECHGAANDPATLVCTPSTSTSTELVTVIDQCNGSGNGGGGTVTCTVDVINNIVGTVAVTSSSVNQCNASGTGGGTDPTVLCDPFPANTTSADVTQCNESGNGGGGTQRVRCTVDSDSTSTTLLDVTVNQCNGSGNGGGATVTCRTGITSNVTAPAPAPSASPSEGSGSGGDGSGGTGSDGPETSGSGGDDEAGGSGGGPVGSGMDEGTTGQVVQIPVGGAATGGGSTTGIESLTMLWIGVGLVSGAGAVVLLRRRLVETHDRG